MSKEKKFYWPLFVFVAVIITLSVLLVFFVIIAIDRSPFDPPLNILAGLGSGIGFILVVWILSGITGGFLEARNEFRGKYHKGGRK